MKKANKVPGNIPDRKALETEVNAEMAEYEKMSAAEFVTNVKLIARPQEARDDLHEARGFAEAMVIVKELDRQRMKIIKPKLAKKRNSEAGARKALKARYAKRVWTADHTRAEFLAFCERNPKMPKHERVGAFTRGLYLRGVSIDLATVYRYTKPIRK